MKNDFLGKKIKMENEILNNNDNNEEKDNNHCLYKEWNYKYKITFKNGQTEDLNCIFI